MSSKLVLFLTLLAAANSERVLKLVIEITRSGARREKTEFATNPDLPPDDELSAGDLTPVGVRQQYLLGKQMQRTYGHVIGANGENMEIHSSSSYRTETSAAAQVYGILEKQGEPWVFVGNPEGWSIPIKDYQPEPSTLSNALPPGFRHFPVSSPISTRDVIFRPLLAKVCPKLHQQAEAFLDQTTEEKLTKFSTMFDLIDGHGPEKSKRNDFKRINVFCESYLHGLYNDPDFVAVGEVTLKCQVFQKYRTFLLAANRELFSTAVTPFNQFILDYLQDVQVTSRPRFLLVSAHDTMVILFLANLFPNNYKCLEDNFSHPKSQGMSECVYGINFASSIVVEVSIERLTGERWVEVKLDNLPFQIKGQKEMRMNAFKAMLTKFLDPDFNSNCGSFQLEERDQTKFLRLLFYGTLSLVIILVNVLVVLYLFGKTKKTTNIHEGLEESVEN